MTVCIDLREVAKPIMQVSGGRMSQAGGIVRAKALRHKCSLCLKKKLV